MLPRTVLLVSALVAACSLGAYFLHALLYVGRPTALSALEPGNEWLSAAHTARCTPSALYLPRSGTPHKLLFPQTAITRVFLRRFSSLRSLSFVLRIADAADQIRARNYQHYPNGGEFKIKSKSRWRWLLA